MDTLIALGTLTAFLYSTVHLLIGGDLFYDTTVVIMAFIVLGRYFEARATGRASGAVLAWWASGTRLMAAPTTALTTLRLSAPPSDMSPAPASDATSRSRVNMFAVAGTVEMIRTATSPAGVAAAVAGGASYVRPARSQLSQNALIVPPGRTPYWRFLREFARCGFGGGTEPPNRIEATRRGAEAPLALIR